MVSGYRGLASRKVNTMNISTPAAQYLKEVALELRAKAIKNTNREERMATLRAGIQLWHAAHENDMKCDRIKVRKLRTGK